MDILQIYRTYMLKNGKEVQLIPIVGLLSFSEPPLSPNDLANLADKSSRVSESYKAALPLFEPTQRR